MKNATSISCVRAVKGLSLLKVVKESTLLPVYKPKARLLHSSVYHSGFAAENASTCKRDST